MVRPCHRICTSMSLEQSSSGARPLTSTDSPFCKGEITLEAMHFAWNGKWILSSRSHGLLLWPIGIHDDFLVDALLADWIALRFCHGSLRLKELTDSGKAQQLFRAHHRVFEPRLVFVRVIELVHFE